MKNKILIYIFILSCIFMSGCEAEYSLTISNDKFEEKIHIFGDPDLKNTFFDEYTKKTYLDYLNEKYEQPYEVYLEDKINGDYGDNYNEDAEHYKVTKVDDDDKFGIIYNYSVDYLDYLDTNFVGTCFDYSSIYSNDVGNRVLITDDSFKCWFSELDSLKIRINLPYKVINTNADEVDGENYIWNYDSSNYDEKNIFIEYSTDTYNDERVADSKVKSFINTNFLPIFSAIILIIAGIILFIIKKKQDKVNKI